MNFRLFWQQISPSFLLSLLIGSTIPVNAQTFPAFSVDPASPLIEDDTTDISPNDVLQRGPAVFIPGTDLGLSGDILDNLNALSSGRDPIPAPLFFSVDRVAVGLPGTAVNEQAESAFDAAAGDVYQALPPDNSNQLFINETELGLTPDFMGDDLDALELSHFPSPFIYFSIDQLSISNGFGFNGLADDILFSSGDGSFEIFAEGSLMGLDDGIGNADDLDALALWDFFEPGVLNPGIDLALFSLSTFSASTFTTTGNSYQPGIKGSLSPADILITDFTGDFALFASANDIGLLPDDDVDALDTKVPEPSTLLGTGIVLAFGFFFSKKQK